MSADPMALVTPPAVERPAVLVVDDEPSNLTAFREILASLDADIVTVGSGQEALRQVLRREFCAILMDVRMPEMDGYETVGFIRQRERSRRIPVIFLTAYDRDNAQVYRGYSEGAVDYVFKPVEPVVLRAKVSVFVELFRQSAEIRAKAEQERRLLRENMRIRSEQVAAERQLRTTEAREATILRLLPIAVYEAAPAADGPVRTFLHSESAERLLGFSALDLSPDPGFWPDRMHDEDRERAVGAMRGLAPGDSYSVEYRWRCADGGYRTFLDQGVMAEAPDSDGPARIYGTLLDVHERHLLEQQLMHAQKIDTIGKLTGGIAHDFNNMLTVVIGNLDALQRNEELGGRAARRVDRALQGALHCRDFTQRLLGFARAQNLAPQVLDLNAQIRGLSDLVARTLGERVEIETELAEGLWPVRSDPGQIESALLNLLVNARDAMPDGGAVTIRTGNVTIGRDRVEPAPDLRNGPFVMIEVADSGVGMAPEVLARATEAFFTTKAAGHGTGLGLSTIHGFVRRAEGDLTISSRAGEGTRVRLYFPRDTTATDARGVAAEGEARGELPRARKRECILVVEDEEAVRQSAVSTLRELGYTVKEAGNADAALAALDASKRVCLLFTDIIMPGSANGYQLAREAQRRRPELKVLFTSAYGGEVTAGSEAPVDAAFLRKPYRDFELAQAIRSAMD
ncbi:response regulator [Marinibaculum pumilum]|uniref:histidine kinase n=1 Tax=Marinibaculum pumilum TaxID=1766165 RepID=A0ABV7L7P1_9PROT